MESDVKCKCAWCGLDVKTVKTAEGDVGIKCGGVASVRGAINGHAKVDGELSVQSLKCPGLSDRLPGHGGQTDHFLAAPSMP